MVQKWAIYLLGLGVKKGQKTVKKGLKMGPKSDPKHHPDDPKWVIGMVFHDHVLARNPLVSSEKRDLKMYKIWNMASIPMS